MLPALSSSRDRERLLILQRLHAQQQADMRQAASERRTTDTSDQQNKRFKHREF